MLPARKADVAAAHSASMTALTSSTTFTSFKYASVGGSFSSRIRRSTLLTTRDNAARSLMAARTSRSVEARTPSTASTTTTAPSAIRKQADTSSLKFAWPGQSRHVTSQDFPRESGRTRLTGVDLIDSCRSCSSVLASEYRYSTLGSQSTLCAYCTKASTSTVFPLWSDPTSATLRITSGRSIRPTRNAVLYVFAGASLSSNEKVRTSLGFRIGSSNGCASSSRTTVAAPGYTVDASG